MTDRRTRKSDEAIRAAFLRLLFSVRFETISMSRLAAEADISRSTLYQHYPTRERILQATMTHIIDALANALTGEFDSEAINPTLVHFWENRRLSRAVFGPPVDAQVRRWLAEAVENKLVAAGRTANDARLAAIPAAAGTIALLDQWMTGHLDVPRADIARSLIGRAAVA